MTDTELRLAWCGLAPQRAAELIRQHGAAQTALEAIGSGKGRYTARARRVARARDDLRAALRRLGVVAVGRDDPMYPIGLLDLELAPAVLFVRGAVPSMPMAAVVGTRRCSGYGRRLAHEFGIVIAEAGWPLVSGLARGIDGHAHRGTAAAQGIGVAVLGSGPDVWYPPEHQELGRRLVDLGGAVVTEAPPGTPPAPWRFPVRNRLIAAMAGAVVVVEAGLTGGALITAALALELGRPVFVVPGDVHRPTAAGCNALIRDGAHPVLGAEDLVDALAAELGPPPAHPVAPKVDDPVLRALRRGRHTLAELESACDIGSQRLATHVARLEAGGAVVRTPDGWAIAGDLGQA